jgi:hypothetical protein
LKLCNIRVEGGGITYDIIDKHKEAIICKTKDKDEEEAPRQKKILLLPVLQELENDGNLSETYVIF